MLGCFPHQGEAIEDQRLNDSCGENGGGSSAE
jgi:hypothetical protein